MQNVQTLILPPVQLWRQSRDVVNQADHRHTVSVVLSMSNVTNGVWRSEPGVHNFTGIVHCVDDAKVEQQVDQLLFGT